MKDYLGIGVSAVGCYNDIRYENVKMLKEYFNCMSKYKLPINESEYLDIETRKKEFIFLSLRTVKGISIYTYNSIFNENFYEKYNNIINKNIEYFIKLDDYLYIKKYYFNYVDEISLLLL